MSKSEDDAALLAKYAQSQEANTKPAPATWGVKTGGVDAWTTKAANNDPSFTSLTVLPMR